MTTKIGKTSTPALWLGILGLALLFALLRWNNFNAPLTRDEGEYAYAAQLLVHGRLPYENSFLQKPPMVAYSYALARLIAPDVFWAPRVLADVFAALATLLLGYAARREFGPGVALPAMWMMTPMILLPKIEEFIANTEMFMLLPLMGVIAVYVRSRHGKGGAGHWLAAGALAAITVCYKYTAFPLLGLVFAIWSFEEWREGRRPRALAAHLLAAGVGAIAAAAIVLGPFLLSDGGKHLWECTVVFNRMYAASDYFNLANTWRRVSEFWRAWWLIFFVPGLVVFKPERRVWFWAALFCCAWLVSAGNYYGQYYISIMPFWALLAAVGLRSFAQWVAFNVSPSWIHLRPALAVIVVLGLVLPDAAYFTRSPRQFADERLGPWQTFLNSPLMAAQLARITAPGDPVYVAGSEPQILCYAHRFSCTRFDIAYPCMIPTPLVQGYQAEAMTDLQRTPPAAIVVVRSRSSWMMHDATPRAFGDFLRKLLTENYEIAGACLSDDSQGWLHPKNPGETLRCAMILYKRKTPAKEK